MYKRQVKVCLDMPLPELIVYRDRLDSNPKMTYEHGYLVPDESLLAMIKGANDAIFIQEMRKAFPDRQICVFVPINPPRDWSVFDRTD